MKGQLTYWEKISNHTSRIHREFSVQLSKTTGNPTEKTEKQMGKDMSRHFTKEHTGIDMKHMRRGSTPLVTGKLQITTTVRHHYPSTRIAINSKTDNTNGSGRGYASFVTSSKPLVLSVLEFIAILVDG